MEILTGYLLADFLSGVAHWFEDVYLNPEDFEIKEGFIFEIAKDNKEHHTKPRKMISSPWYSTISVTCAFTLPAAILCYLVFGFNWIWTTCLFLASWMNQIHKWQHMSIKERPLLVSWLMVFGVFADSRHHAGHHVKPYTTHYCILSPYLNPILDATRFWRGIEFIIHLHLRK